MTRKLFGTDGVRGLAGEVLSAELALGLGQAATRLLAGERPQVLVVRDTRESGPMLEAALAAGIAAAGGDVLLGGVLPTAAAPLLIDRYGLQMGAVISASHNPYEDNGIKFFGSDGYKLSDETELRIEGDLAEARAGGPEPAAERARARRRRARLAVAGGPRWPPRAGARLGGSAICVGPTRTTCARSTHVLPSSTCTVSTWFSTAPTAPPAESHLRSSGGWART